MKYPVVIAFLLLGALQTGPALAEELVLVADQWCPYNCEPESDAPGFIVELARLALEPEGFQVIYRVVPWARAIEGTRIGQYSGIIGAGRDEVPNFVFPESAAATVYHDFFVAAGSPWRYEGIDSLIKIRLGVIKDYSYGTLFDDYILPNQEDEKRIFMATGDAPLARIIRMLLAGRVDVIVEDRNVMQKQLVIQGLEGKLNQAGLAAREEVFLAFSPVLEDSKRYAEIFDGALAHMQASGVVAELMVKYGIARP